MARGVGERKWGRWLIAALVVVVAALVIVRIMLPEWVRAYAERRLSEAPDYKARIGSVELHILAGGAVVRDIEMVKESGQVPVPFLSAPVVNASLNWRVLWKQRILAVEVYAEGAQVNAVSGPDKQRSQYIIDPAWIERMRQTMPFRLNVFRLTKGEVRYRDFHSSPKVDVSLHDLEVEAANLTNVEAVDRARYASLRVTGALQGSGRLNVAGELDPLGRPPSFSIDASLEKLDLTQLNDLLRAYASVDVKKGEGDIYAEMLAEGGSYEGYVKPLFKGVEVLEAKDIEKGPLRFAWEALVAGVKKVFENEPREQVATKIPIKGKFERTDIDVMTAIGWLFRNAFVEALRGGVDESIDLGGAKNRSDAPRKSGKKGN